MKLIVKIKILMEDTSIMSKPENINIQKYKSIRLDKLADTLEIVGFNISDLRLEPLQKKYYQ
jgi:hypothetical protein